MKTLLNRRVLITGGGSGIGARTAGAIVDRGGKVAVFDIEGDAAQRTAESLGAIQSLSFQGDVTDPEAIEGVLDAMCEVWGGIDDLVNNVGIYDHGSLLELTVSQWRRVFDVNFMAPVAVSCAAVRRMRPGSSIVNVSSVLGQMSAPERGPYCVSKAALISLTKMQALEWAEREIRVNAIAPDTSVMHRQRTLSNPGALIMRPSAVVHHWEGSVLKKRWLGESASSWILNKLLM